MGVEAAFHLAAIILLFLVLITAAVTDLLHHLNQRPDHVVYVDSPKSRDEMRQVFNWWKKEGALRHNPDIKIEYALQEGSIRVAE